MLRSLLCYISISIGLFKVEDVLVQKWLLYVQHLSKRNIVCRSTERSFCTKLSTYSIVSLLRPHIVLVIFLDIVFAQETLTASIMRGNYYTSTYVHLAIF